MLIGLTAEEVVEADFVQGGGRGVRGNVAADAFFLLVGADHHGHGVPADDVADLAFKLEDAGVGWLLVCRDGVDVGRVGREGNPDALAVGVQGEFAQDFAHAVGAGAVQDFLE